MRKHLSAGIRLCLFAGAICLPAAGLAQSVHGPSALATATAQTGPRLVDAPTRTDGLAQMPDPSRARLPRGARTVRPGRQSPTLRVVLRRVVVEGATAVSPRAVAALWQAEQGRTLGLAEIDAIADGVGALYKRAGLALYTVSVPSQSFAGGVVRLRVVEGYVAEVAITGEVGHADMSLLRHYAASLVADRPLHQARLERAILLMGAIPGCKVSSRFEPIAHSAGGVRLVLIVQRKRFDAGIGVNNQGFPLLGRSQFEANVVANSLFQQGDRTQLTIGLPPERFETYQYIGLSELQPLGYGGATLAASIGALRTRTTGLGIAGTAVFADLQAAVPLVRRVHQSLTVTLAFDALDSNNALLGQTLSDERTRAVRGRRHLRLRRRYAARPDRDEQRERAPQRRRRCAGRAARQHRHRRTRLHEILRATRARPIAAGKPCAAPAGGGPGRRTAPAGQRTILLWRRRFRPRFPLRRDPGRFRRSRCRRTGLAGARTFHDAPAGGLGAVRVYRCGRHARSRWFGERSRQFGRRGCAVRGAEEVRRAVGDGGADRGAASGGR